MLTLDNYDSIVISGGAFKVFSIIGAFKYIEKHCSIKKIIEYIGSSAGSILCLFLILDYTAEEMKTSLREALDKEEINTINFTEDNILGLFSGSCINLLIKYILKKINKEDITFSEISKITGKNLVVVCGNLTKRKEEFFSLETTPDFSIITAIRISCSLPLVFNPIKINDCLYIDGGFYNNYAYDYKSNITSKRFGILIISEDEKEDNFTNYIKNIITSMIYCTTEKKINKHTLILNITEYEWINLEKMKIVFENDKLEDTINQGYIQTQNFFEKFKNQEMDLILD